MASKYRCSEKDFGSARPDARRPETGAERILVTHVYVPPVVRCLREQGLAAYGLETRFEGEQEEVV